MIFKKTVLKRNDLVYPELSYKIVGILFEVYNNSGYGYQEKHYQRAIALLLKEKNILFKEQVGISLVFKSNNIGKYFLDFLIDDKIVLEIKKGDRFSKIHIDQINNYLKSAKYKLGILATFTSGGIKFKRILNI